MGSISRRKRAAGTGQADQSDQITLWLLRALTYRDHAVSLMDARGWGAEELLNVAGLDSSAANAGDKAAVRRGAKARLEELESGETQRSHDVFDNVALLGPLLELNKGEQELLAFAVLLNADEHLNECVTGLLKRCRGSAHAALHTLAHVLGEPLTVLEGALRADSPLGRSGLIRFRPGEASRGLDCLELDDVAGQVLTTSAATGVQLVDRLLATARPAELGFDDYRHVEEDVALIRGYLAQAVKRRVPGVNILLHGPPGTGKTELAHLIAGDVASDVISVRCEDLYGEPMSRIERLRNYQLAQALFARKGDAVVIFDELEDAFPTPPPGPMFAHRNVHHDKAWANQQVESNPSPSVWISNSIDQLDAALVRRFDLIVELRRPPIAVRERIVRRYLPELATDDEWVGRVASDERVTPADVARAARIARIVGLGDRASARGRVDRVLDLNLTARTGPRPARYRHDAARYDLSLLNTSVPIDELVAGLARGNGGSICLYGPPGTGKTAFVHHVADHLQTPVVHTLASDLLSCWVGGTEKAFAAMFRNAREDGAILFLDEGDSFLRDRAGARQTWEVTQVNELLVQMERFEGLFFCSTNLMEGLDPAVFRRFAVKVRFDPLTAAQRWRMAGTLLTEVGRRPRGPARAALERQVRGLDGLTAGDVAAARRRFEVCGQRPTAEEVVAALTEELEARGAAPRRGSLGFRGATDRTGEPACGSRR